MEEGEVGVLMSLAGLWSRDTSVTSNPLQWGT